VKTWWRRIGHDELLDVSDGVEFRRTSCACRRSGSWEKGSEDASLAVLLGVLAISNFDSGSVDASTCHRG
jgi:hypothetical protein